MDSDPGQLCPELDELENGADLAPTASPAPHRRVAGAKYAASSNFYEALADFIISKPGVSHGEIAKFFDYSVSWISTVIASDAFQAYLHKRKDDIVDPLIRGQLEDIFKGLALRSTAVLMEKMSQPASAISDNLALAVFRESARAAGYGARVQINTQINNTNESDVDKQGAQLLTLLRRTRREAETLDAESSTVGQDVPSPERRLEPSVPERPVAQSGQAEGNVVAWLEDIKSGDKGAQGSGAS